MNNTIPVTVVGRPLAARSFVPDTLLPGLVDIDLRAKVRHEYAHQPVLGLSYMPYTHSVERWVA
jgi:hypothetical protein